MSFWTIILAIIVGLVIFALLIVIYALFTPKPTKEDLMETGRKLERRRKESQQSANAPKPPQYPHIFIQ